MNKKALLRIVVGLVALLSVFVLPWWFSFILGILFLFLFEFYIEAVLFAWMMDTLYSNQSWFLGAYLLTMSMVAIFVLAEFLKKRIVYYD